MSGLKSLRKFKPLQKLYMKRKKKDLQGAKGLNKSQVKNKTTRL